MTTEQLIPRAFWSNDNGPWWWSAAAGVHDAAAHASCPSFDGVDLDTVPLETLDSLCHIIE